MPGKNIVLNITFMDIEYWDIDTDYYGDDYYDTLVEDYYQIGFEGLICHDFLVVADGASMKSPLIDVYCGSERNISLPIEIRSSKNNLWIG